MPILIFSQISLFLKNKTKQNIFFKNILGFAFYPSLIRIVIHIVLRQSALDCHELESVHSETDVQ